VQPLAWCSRPRSSPALLDGALERVTGIGGVFFKAKDPDALRRWYEEHLGIAIEDFGGAAFRWDAPGSTVWSIFPADTDYFGPASQAWMVNFRVSNLDAMLGQLRAAGAEVDSHVEEHEYGRFGWAVDPEGNRFELWEPPEGM
jgi:predicted enzyme related to lactoylglutathione lyase